MGCGSCNSRVSDTKILSSNQSLNNNIILASTHYNIIVWAAKPSLLKRYYELPTQTIPYETTRLVINYIPVSPPASANRKADSLICLVDKLSRDAEKIRQVVSSTESVWSKKLLCRSINRDVLFFSQSINTKVYSDEAELLYSIYKDDNVLVHLLKDVFRCIDTDNSGTISVLELQKAAEIMGKQMDQEEIKMGIDKIDLNSDQSISFEEFKTWWKNGKEGFKSFKKIVNMWAKSITATIPGSTDVIKRMQRNKIKFGCYQKNFELFYGNFSHPESFFTLKLGKSLKRDKFTRKANEMLGLFGQHFWLSFEFKFKPNRTNDLLVRKIKLMINCILSYHVYQRPDTENLRDIISYEVRQIDDTVFVGFWVDLKNSSLYNSISYIDNLLVTPEDDYLEAELNFKEKINKFITKSGILLTEFLTEGFNIKGELRHWVSLITILSNITGVPESNPILSLFLPYSAKIKTNLKRLDYGGIYKLAMQHINHFCEMTKDMILVTKLIELLIEEFQDDFLCYFRCANIGGVLRANGICPVIKYIISNHKNV